MNHLLACFLRYVFVNLFIDDIHLKLSLVIIVFENNEKCATVRDHFVVVDLTGARITASDISDCDISVKHELNRSRSYNIEMDTVN